MKSNVVQSTYSTRLAVCVDKDLACLAGSHLCDVKEELFGEGLTDRDMGHVWDRLTPRGRDAEYVVS